jgi:hypothetical protein
MFLTLLGNLVGVGFYFPNSYSYGADGFSCIYKGTFAKSEYQAISGCSGAPPVENDDRSNVTCHSWSEACFGTELFTTINFVENQTTFPLSRMSIASLQDAGYTVDYSQADAYGRADLNPNCTCGSGRVLSTTTVAKGAPPPRRLSSEGHRAAISSGKMLLAKEQAQRDLAGRSEQDASVQYVGDQMVTILYMENGHIYDVVVRRDD